MPILNSRHRKIKRKKGKIMESEVMINQNHKESGSTIQDPLVNSPLPTSTPAAVPPGEGSVALSKLVDRREKLIQGLNAARAQKEAITQRLKDIELSIGRTEGAVITVENFINEIDPGLLDRMAQAQQQG